MRRSFFLWVELIVAIESRAASCPLKFVFLYGLCVSVVLVAVLWLLLMFRPMLRNLESDEGKNRL